MVEPQPEENFHEIFIFISFDWKSVAKADGDF